MMPYDVQEDYVVSEVVARRAKRVLIQMPEGLKPLGFGLAKRIEEATGSEALISGDPCYGACDLALYQMERLGADLLIHVGHAEIPGESPSDKIIYVEARVNLPIEKPMKEALKLLEREKVLGLAASVQHIHTLDEARRILEENGKMVKVGKPSGWLKYEGQVLGCDYGSILDIKDEVDAFLIISGGSFHGLGVPLATGKRTIVVDPFTQQARDLTELYKKILKQRWVAITRFKEAGKVGVVVGMKSSQMHLSLARRVKELLEEAGKDCVIICATELYPEALENFTDIEAFVETACSRIATDDRERYRKPILNVEEAMVAIGKKAWEAHLGSYAQQT